MSVVKTLYRTLLNSARTFDATGSPLTALIHRTEPFNSDHIMGEERQRLSASLSDEDYQHEIKVSQGYHDSLNKYLGGEHVVLLSPKHARELSVVDLVRKGFRENHTVDGEKCDDAVDVEVAFLVLKELNKKIRWAEKLGVDIKTLKPKASSSIPPVSSTSTPQSSTARPLPSSHALRPGTFLLSHPLLSGFFSRSVIVLLEHTQAEGSYGLIVNKPSQFDSELTLKEAFRIGSIPEALAETFGDVSVRNGGPVNVNLQMLHKLSPDQEQCSSLGGRVIPSFSLEGENDNSDVSAAVDSDDAIYTGGDIFQALKAVQDETLQKNQFAFSVGASTWVPNQLADELEAGFWIPCSAGSGLVMESDDGNAMYGKLMEQMGFEGYGRISGDAKMGLSKEGEGAPSDHQR